MPGRTFNSEGYRYGFNGKEKDDKGEWGSTHYGYGFRIYNPGIARFLRVDPLAPDYPWYTPYQFAGNKPIAHIDMDGLEEWFYANGDLSDISGPLSSKARSELKLHTFNEMVDISFQKVIQPAMSGTTPTKANSFTNSPIKDPNTTNTDPIGLALSGTSAGFATSGMFLREMGKGLSPKANLPLGNNFNLTGIKAGDGAGINLSSVRFKSSANTGHLDWMLRQVYTMAASLYIHFLKLVVLIHKNQHILRKAH
jgi:RHS repeat-associated protein